MEHAAQLQVHFTNSDHSAERSVSLIGTYGRNSRRTFVSGHLIHVHSEGGVNHGCTNYTHALPNHDWVALMERGECMFTQKLKLATWDNNASAVIIYNNEAAGNTPFRIRSPVNNTVYVFLERDSGRRLAELVDSGGHVHVDISPLPDVSSSASSSPVLHVALALVLVLAALPAGVARAVVGLGRG